MIKFRNEVTNKKRVLIVDDDQAVRQMLSMTLELRGYEVAATESGEKAVGIASKNHLDLILLDLILPDLEGFEVCRRLKEEKNTNHIPIIILSSRYLSEDKVEGLYLGADDYLTKPFEYEELIARMEAVTRRYSFIQRDSDAQYAQNVVIELNKIINAELIEPFFQPIYFLKPFKLFGLEVLNRAQSQSVLANPEMLFKLAFRFGIYQDLEILGWRKALKIINGHMPEEKIFLNCHPYFIEGPRFDDIQNVLKDYHVPSQNIVLEVTERSEVSDFKAFFASLNRFRAKGFWLAVDDVGRGYASLESIVETRPEVVKIDQHIIANIHRDHFKRSIVKCIVGFCRENKIITIAEGIENKEDLQTVIELGVDAAQGFFLYRPTRHFDLAHFRKP